MKTNIGLVFQFSQWPGLILTAGHPVTVHYPGKDLGYELLIAPEMKSVCTVDENASTITFFSERAVASMIVDDDLYQVRITWPSSEATAWILAVGEKHNSEHEDILVANAVDSLKHILNGNLLGLIARNLFLLPPNPEPEELLDQLFEAISTGEVLLSSYWGEVHLAFRFGEFWANSSQGDEK